jgi:CheY-like chemotaxis protein
MGAAEEAAVRKAVRLRRSSAAQDFGYAGWHRRILLAETSQSITTLSGAEPMTSSPLLRPLILCIDDAEIALRVRKLVLTGAGYSVLTAPSGEEGLEAFKQNPIQLVIADHFLSDKTGAEIAKEMKEYKPEVPILIVSAASEAPEGLEFADGFLSKGEGPDALLESIARLLHDRHNAG